VRIKGTLFIVIFLMAFFAGDRLLAMLLDQVLLRSQFRFSVLYKGGQQYDIIIMGNSRGVNSFYTPAIQETTGKTTVNMSYNGMSTDLAEALFMDYLDRNRKPKLLILEISNVTDESGLLNELKLYAAHSERLAKLLRAANPQVALWTEASHIFKFNGEMFLRTLYYYQESDQTWINRYQISPALLQSTRSGRDGIFRATPENLAALKRIIKVARTQGIEVRAVVGPYLPAYCDQITNFQDWMNQIRKAIGSDIRIWDYTRAIVDTTAFADREHLNYQGTIVLLKSLVRDGIFDESSTASALSLSPKPCRRIHHHG
jgi:hypothetical protein